MLALKKPKAPMAENVRIFSVDEAEKLLRTAERTAPQIVPYLAIGLFAGLRPQRELACLKEEYIDLEGRCIYVPRSVAKGRVNRDVPISDNLAAWLEAYPVHGIVGGKRITLRNVKKEAKVEWSSDIMRHTRASFRLAQTRDPVRTADEMGHGVDVLKRHYANRGIPAADVERYWNLMPGVRRPYPSLPGGYGSMMVNQSPASP